tara:strand:+ start:392 stop:640 length:249 start_codon:yes stop_codon:yes gene_type:complete
MLVRCNACGKDLQSDGNKIISCGCSNMTSVHDDVVSANDMDQVIILQNNKKFKKQSLFSAQDLEYQEARRRRGVRKMFFEER